METIFKGKTCAANYFADKKRIEYSYFNYANIEEHKLMYLKAMEFMKENSTEQFLMDFREMKGTFTMLNDWVIDLFRPAVELGLKKNAMVLNDDIFTQFAANDALGKIKLIQIQVFKDIDEARLWCEAD